ncbi:hypothetical protein L4C42_16220 [Vibrio wakamikoensis]|uniref:hypothetical protein n=1 Tax=Vibrio wakamikoensis TaxID=2910251 RepID=UPI003D2279D0
MSNKIESNEKSYLTLRNFRDVSILAFFGVMSVKLFSMELKVDIKEFTFTDLLSMVLAFFAIALSVAFYFKATDTSNRFYDNSYAFTKEVSEILGRIEAGFGERLRHLDEGYSGIRDKFDKLPYDSTQVKAEIEKEKEEVRKKEAEQQTVLEDLAKRAHLAEAEKDELFSRMKQITKELDDAKRESRRLTRSMRLHAVESDSRYEALDYLQKLMDDIRPANLDPLSRRGSYGYLFQDIANDIPRSMYRDLERYGYVENGSLSREAIRLMKSKQNRQAS